MGPSPVPLLVDGLGHLAGRYDVPGVGACTVLIPQSFPTSAPIIVRDLDDAPLGVEWDLRVPPEDRLKTALDLLCSQGPPKAPGDQHDPQSEGESSPESNGQSEQGYRPAGAQLASTRRIRFRLPRCFRHNGRLGAIEPAESLSSQQPLGED